MTTQFASLAEAQFTRSAIYLEIEETWSALDRAAIAGWPTGALRARVWRYYLDVIDAFHQVLATATDPFEVEAARREIACARTSRRDLISETPFVEVQP